ncbi:hypothetical protein HYE67_008076 [Fusarium culmorum]|uniref:Uncharacterized protein n=1 Tax=Fusarium culmorum TaxID=5516 RepID=A0A2T4H7Y8_FUSCU|nr:hypothetical protein FCULG_00002751 [Fusarium culmorum]QPC65845.1 hypothetical protein HYE67_008076 [Fusarium culmorum]
MSETTENTATETPTTENPTTENPATEKPSTETIDVATANTGKDPPIQLTYNVWCHKCNIWITRGKYPAFTQQAFLSFAAC